MAIFSNQATITVGGVTTSSNIAYGELLEQLTATKVALEGSYTPNGAVTYVVSLRNTGSTPLTDVTITDNLGAYTAGGATVYPLALTATDAAVFVGGVRQDAAVVNPGPPLTVTGITIPAETDAVLVYQAQVTQFANPAGTGAITNTATVTAPGLPNPIVATETVPAATGPELSITKSISPTQVVDNDRVTYTFVIRNSGNTAVALADNAVIEDVFNPILTDLVVSFNGVTWTEGVQYTYEAATGRFATTAGQLAVPAATFTQDPVTGAYTVTPGIATLVVTGTI